MQPITYDITDDVAVLTFHPTGSVTTLNWTVIDTLDGIVEWFLESKDIRGAVVTGAGKDFVVGADLAMIADIESDAGDAAQLLERWSSLNRILRRLETGGKPVAAALNGSALGGGYEIALACHRRFVADTPTIKIGLPETRLGMIPAGGGTQRLPRLIGAEPACDLMLSARLLDPAAALDRGLVDELVAPGELLDRAREWVATDSSACQPWDAPGFEPPGGPAQSAAGIQVFERLSTSAHATNGDHNPHVPALLTSVFRGLHSRIEVGTRIENTQHLRLLREHSTPRRLIRTEFHELNKLRRQPARPAEPPYEMTSIGVVGAGMMGAGIAEVARRSGLDVVLVDKSDDRLAAVADGIGGVSTATAISAVAGCQLVIEAVPENTALKHEVLAEIGAAAPDAIIATNTSSLPVAGLAHAVQRPENFLGLHFVFPAQTTPMIEVISGPQSGPGALAAGYDLVARLGKVAMPVGDAPGFFGTRLFLAFVSEGASLVAEGVPAALVENAARQAGFTTGPLQILDEVSIPLALEVLDMLGGSETTTKTVLRTMVETGRHGRRVAAGFYDYTEQGRQLWPALADPAATFGVTEPRAMSTTVGSTRERARAAGHRMLMAAALEGVRAREAGVVDAVGPADLASVMAGMFPRHTGGVFSFLDDEGPAAVVARADALHATGRHGFDVPPTLRALAEDGGAWHHTHRDT